MKRIQKGKTITSDSSMKQDDTVCQLKLPSGWNEIQYKKAMQALINSHDNFIPIAVINEALHGYLKNLYDNRYKKPTKEELDN